ncbi:MAG: hypothetical protein AB8G05_27250 [Oligoflexales bacterium]
MNENLRQRIQNQLRQYLKDYRNINSLSAELAAENLEVEIATYRILEGKKPSNRVISVLEYLHKIAQLNKMSLSSFISFLERNGRTESGTLEMKRKLFNWEQELLDKFDYVGIPLRNRFLKGFLGMNKEEVADSLTCLTRIVSMPKNKRDVLFSLVKEMVSK